MILKYAIIALFKANRRQFIEENVCQWTRLGGKKWGAWGVARSRGTDHRFLGHYNFPGLGFFEHELD